MAGRAPNAYSLAVQAVQQIGSTGLPILEPIADKTTVGSFYVRVGVAIGTGATNVAIVLQRKPSGCLTFNSSAGTLVYQTTADSAASTPSVFVCRSTAATTATILVG